MELLFKENAAPRGKKSGPRQWYVNFGGWAPHPQLDIEAFNVLPPRRQREMLECQRIFREVPDVRAYEIIDLKTGKPYPDQKLASDYYQKTPNTEKLSAIPLTVKFTIPNGVSLAEFRRHPVEYSQIAALEAVRDHVVRWSLEMTTTEGCRALALQKPLDGIFAFIWRCARYHGGLDVSIPVTAFWDLEDGISRLTGLRSGASEDVVGFLEQSALELVETVGGEKNVAALRWARITGEV